MQMLIQKIVKRMGRLWHGLREWSGDAAYERYLQCALNSSIERPLSETDFYVEELKRRYSRPNRCC
jgi:hypothetical protein